MTVRLEEEIAREEEIHKRVMAELTQPIEVPPPYLANEESQDGEGLSYAARVQQLQMMVGTKSDLYGLKTYHELSLF